MNSLEKIALLAMSTFSLGATELYAQSGQLPQAQQCTPMRAVSPTARRALPETTVVYLPRQPVTPPCTPAAQPRPVTPRRTTPRAPVTNPATQTTPQPITIINNIYVQPTQVTPSTPTYTGPQPTPIPPRTGPQPVTNAPRPPALPRAIENRHLDFFVQGTYVNDNIAHAFGTGTRRDFYLSAGLKGAAALGPLTITGEGSYFLSGTGTQRGNGSFHTSNLQMGRIEGRNTGEASTQAYLRVVDWLGLTAGGSYRHTETGENSDLGPSEATEDQTLWKAGVFIGDERKAHMNVQGGRENTANTLSYLQNRNFSSISFGQDGDLGGSRWSYLVELMHLEGHKLPNVVDNATVDSLTAQVGYAFSDNLRVTAHASYANDQQVTEHKPWSAGLRVSYGLHHRQHR